MTVDIYGHEWPDGYEVCSECGQPDNCGDCNHQPLSDEDRAELLGDEEA